MLDSSTGTAELLVDGFSTKIARSHQEPRVLVCPSSIGLSSRTLRCLTGRLAARRGKIGTDPMATSDRRLSDSARLAHLRCGDTCAQLAAGFGIEHRNRVPVHTRGRRSTGRARTHPGRSDVHRPDHNVRDPGRHPAAHRPNRRDTAYYSGKHKRHGMNVQVLAEGLASSAEAPVQHQPRHRDRSGRPRPSSRLSVRWEKLSARWTSRCEVRGARRQPRGRAGGQFALEGHRRR